MHEFFASNKVELFNMWLDADKSWDHTVLAVERKHQQKSTAKTGWVAQQGRDIKARLGEEKGAAIIKARTDSGMFYKDPDFPDSIDDSSFDLHMFGTFLWFGWVNGIFQFVIKPLLHFITSLQKDSRSQSKPPGFSCCFVVLLR